MFVYGESWREGGGLSGIGLMKATSITVSLDTNLPVGHLPGQFCSLTCVPGRKEHLCTAEHPPVLAWHRFQQKDFSRAVQEQVKGEGRHQRGLVQVAWPALGTPGFTVPVPHGQKSQMKPVTILQKQLKNYNTPALILRSICLLALVPLGSDPPGFLCLYNAVLLFLSLFCFKEKPSPCSIHKTSEFGDLRRTPTIAVLTVITINWQHCIKSPHLDFWGVMHKCALESMK